MPRLTRLACILALLFLSGCVTATPQTAKPQIFVTSPEQTQPSEHGNKTTPHAKGIQIADLQPFTTHTEWPQIPSDPSAPAIYSIKSGTDDMVWVEGRGYFRGSLEDVYRDLIDPMVIGPTHVTNNIVQDQLEQTDSLTTYVMHVKVRYIITVEFDLSASLEPLFDGNSQAGWFYQNEKTSGSSMISVISTYLAIRELDGGWFSAEFLSLNKAAQNKESESRGHLEALFSHWEELSKTRRVDTNAMVQPEG